MAGTAVLCTDGSDLALQALTAGWAVMDHGLTPLVVTVVEPADPALVTGTGFAGGVMSPEELAAVQQENQSAATDALARTTEALGLAGAETRTLAGSPGPAICDVAAEIGAAVVLIGSHGRGGLKRAVLGSVSDHVVRHTTCPVVVTTPADD